MYEHLLVGLDGSRAAEQVLEHAVALAAAFGSTVTLVRATISPETLIAETTTSGQNASDLGSLIDPTPILEATSASAQTYLENIAARLRDQQLTVNIEHSEGSAADVIVDRASELGISLILLTTQGRGGLGRMMFGSVADSVLRHAPCPVLLVRVPADSPQEHEAEPPISQS